MRQFVVGCTREYLVDVTDEDDLPWEHVDALDMSYYQRLTPLFWANHSKPWMVIHKATEGTQILDARFGERWAHLRWLNWRRGAYHFYDPDERGSVQAAVFYRVVAPRADEVLVVDFEEFPRAHSKTWAARQVKDFLEYLADRTGMAPMVYTRANVWDMVVGEAGWASQYPLWVACYNSYAEAPVLPLAWDKWALWQYGVGRWPGVRGKVDRNRVHKDFAQFLNEQFLKIA